MSSKDILVLIAFTLAVGCAGSPYTDHAKQIPWEKGKSKYYLGSLEVHLTLGHGAIPGDTSYSTEEQLEEQFKKAITAALTNKGIFTSDPSTADASLDIRLDYTRTFNYGGKALNKPKISHDVDIMKDGEKLVTISKGSYTTKYSYFEEIAVNVKIAAFNWGAEDELKDIDLISENIANDLFNVGK